MTWVAGIIVIVSGLWLIGQAVWIVVMPVRAARFLLRFASSARAHYTEQILRLIAGAAIVIFAAEMRFPTLFMAFGWLVVVTTVALLLMPWRWHHWFGQWAIPLAIRHIRLYALGSFALGAFILYAAL